MNLFQNHYKTYFYISILFHAQIYSASSDLNSELVIITENNPPMVYRSSSGEVVGSDVVILKSYLDAANLPYKLELAPWKRALRLVNTRSNYLIYPFSRTAYREDHYLWLFPIKSLTLKLVGLESNPRLAGKDLNPEDLKGKEYSYVCPAKTVICDALLSYGVKQSNLVELPNIDVQQMLAMISRGRIDFMFMSDNGINRFMNNMIYDKKKFRVFENIDYQALEYLAANPGLNKNYLEKLKALHRIQNESQE